MKDTVANTAFTIVVLLTIFASVGVLYYRYIVLHDYEILYLSEEETKAFIEENYGPTEDSASLEESYSSETEGSASSTEEDAGEETE